MPKRSPAAELDQAITALLATPRAMVDVAEGRSDARGSGVSAAVARLLPLVRDLRAMPRPEFKARLKMDLHQRSFLVETAARSATQKEPAKFRRPNFPNIAPYFLVSNAPQFIDFLVSAFEGTERIRVPRPDGSIMHAEVAIGDSVLELGDANEQYPTRPMTIHLYVNDADAIYARALQAGAAALAPVADQHWGDRQGTVKDPFGNTWFIGMPKTWDPAQYGGIRSVQPFLVLRDAAKMIPFVESALGAKAMGVVTSPEGAVLHATIEIAGATLELAEAQPGHPPVRSYLHVYVPDTDAIYAQALAAGAKGTTPPYSAPYGDRAASIEDPFGNTWFLATYVGQDAV
jgi:PhnB protein